MDKTYNKMDGKTEPVKTFSDALLAAKENMGPTVKNAISEYSGQLSHYAQDAKEHIMNKSKEASKAINQSAHAQPWAYIAGASVLGLAFGYMMARKK